MHLTAAAPLEVLLSALALPVAAGLLSGATGLGDSDNGCLDGAASMLRDLLPSGSGKGAGGTSVHAGAACAWAGGSSRTAGTGDLEAEGLARGSGVVALGLAGTAAETDPVAGRAMGGGHAKAGELVVSDFRAALARAGVGIRDKATIEVTLWLPPLREDWGLNERHDGVWFDLCTTAVPCAVHAGRCAGGEGILAAVGDCTRGAHCRRPHFAARDAQGSPGGAATVKT